MTTLAISQHKGGTGKTTTTLNLGASLAQRGFQVLMVDLDPQADLSAGLGVVIDSTVGTSEPSLYRILATEQGSLSEVIVSTGVERLWLAAGTLDMAELELSLAAQISRERALQRALSTVARQYDFILLDCPPSLGLLTINALVAAQQVIVPVQAEPRSVGATTRILSVISTLKRRMVLDDLRVLGLLLTMKNRTNVAREAESVLRSTYGDLVLRTTIRNRALLAEDVLYHAPVLSFSPSSEPAQDYEALASEVLERINMVKGEEVAHAG